MPVLYAIFVLDLYLPLGGAEVLLEAPFSTTRELDDVVRDECYAEALLLLADWSLPPPPAGGREASTPTRSSPGQGGESEDSNWEQG